MSSCASVVRRKFGESIYALLLIYKQRNLCMIDCHGIKMYTRMWIMDIHTKNLPDDFTRIGIKQRKR